MLQGLSQDHGGKALSLSVPARSIISASYRRILRHDAALVHKNGLTYFITSSPRTTTTTRTPGARASQMQRRIVVASLVSVQYDLDGARCGKCRINSILLRFPPGSQSIPRIKKNICSINICSNQQLLLAHHYDNKFDQVHIRDACRESLCANIGAVPFSVRYAQLCVVQGKSCAS